MTTKDVKIKIPSLKFAKDDDMYAKTKAVTAWRNKLRVYAKIHNLDKVLFKEDSYPNQSDLQVSMNCLNQLVMKPIFLSKFPPKCAVGKVK